MNYPACLEHWGFSHIRTVVIDFSFFFFKSAAEEFLDA